MLYQIIDTRDAGRVVSRHKSRREAYRKANRLDAIYGAVRYVVRIVGPVVLS